VTIKEGAEMESGFDSLPSTLLSVADAVQTRRSIRAFIGKPVPQSTVEFILEVASRAPSGSNTQPWRVHAVAGTPLKALSAELRAADKDPSIGEANEEYRYYPAEWFEPYLSRRRKLGWSLYGLLGIRKGDKTEMSRENARNYDFFGAPVAIFFTLDRKLEAGSWLDLGMFM
jgi:nitroreductase